MENSERMKVIIASAGYCIRGVFRHWWAVVKEGQISMIQSKIKWGSIKANVMQRSRASVLIDGGICHKKWLVWVKDIFNDIFIIGNFENWVLLVAGNTKVGVATERLLFILYPKGVAYVWAISTSTRRAGLEFLVKG
jgi:hypothetical protein